MKNSSISLCRMNRMSGGVDTLTKVAFTLELTPYEMYEVQQCKLVFRRGRVFGRCPNHNSSFSQADFPRQEFHEVWLIERTIMGGALAQMPDWEESTNEQPQFY